MNKPNQLYEDMEKLDALYETLGWNHTDPLNFVIEGDKIVIRNLYQEQRVSNIQLTEGHPYEWTSLLHIQVH